MVVPSRAPKIHHLAIIAGEDLHVAGHQEHEISAGRGVPDADNSLTQGRVNARGASEVVELREYFADKMSEQANAESALAATRFRHGAAHPSLHVRSNWAEGCTFIGRHPVVACRLPPLVSGTCNRRSQPPLVVP